MRRKILSVIIAMLMTAVLALPAVASPARYISRVTANGVSLKGSYDSRLKEVTYTGTCKSNAEPNFPLELAMLFSSRNVKNQVLAVTTGSEWLTAGSLSDMAGSGKIARMTFRLTDEKGKPYRNETNFIAKNGRVTGSDMAMSREKSGLSENFYNSFTYDGNGNLLSYEVDSSNPITYRFTWENGLPVSASGSNVAAGRSETYQFTSEGKKIIQADCKSGYQTWIMYFHYNSDGKLSSVTSKDAKGSTGTVVDHIKYAGNGTVISLRLYGTEYQFEYKTI